MDDKKYWSTEELKELEDIWKSGSEYKDVVACHIQDCTEAETVTKCLSGCNLETHKPRLSTAGWSPMQDVTGYRKTVLCLEHGFARIYVISYTNYQCTKNNL